MAERVRIGVVGAGFWARAQVAAWREVEGVELVAVCDPAIERAEALAAAWGIPAAHAGAAELLAAHRPDAVDVIAPDHRHRELVELAVAHGTDAITQKPMAPSLEEAEAMLAAARAEGRRLLVHENFRWQTPVRALKAALVAGEIGRPFRARLQFSCSFPVFDNQPGLREAERFILLDLGVHLMDVARFLFGEVRRVFCRTARVHPGIRGEDVATVHLDHEDGMHTVVELSYASRLADERFPETFALVEGADGSLELGPGHRLRTTTAAGTTEALHPPPRHPWTEPGYELVQAAIVPCHRNLIADVRGERTAETTGEDNLKSLRLVFAAYESAARGEVVAP